MPTLRPVKLKGRLGLVALMVGCLFAAMFVRLWYLQVLASPQLKAAAVANQVRKVTAQAPRGLIVDRVGASLVTNKTVVAITVARTVTPELGCGSQPTVLADGRVRYTVGSPAKAQTFALPPVVTSVARLLGTTAQSVLQTISDCRYSPYEPVPVATDVTIGQVTFIREHQADFPGVAVQELSERSYPAGTAGAHILGYVGSVSPKELASHQAQGYQQGDLVGQAGVEVAYEKWLRGQPGVTDLEVDASGKVIGTLGGQRPQPGDTMQLTIDLALQKQVDSDLANEIATLHNQIDPSTGYYYPAPSGAAIVLDPRNGAVLAMSSYPTYNPSVWVGGISSPEYKALSAPPYTLINRAIDGEYTPGSTFKLVTATAALQDELISPYTVIYDPGYFRIPSCTAGCLFHNNESEALGALSVQMALTASDDVFFYNLGYDFYSQRSRYGPQPIQDVAREYGLGQPTDFDLGQTAQGRVDSPAERVYLHQLAPRAFPYDTWYAGDNVEVAFGQGATVITPLQLADAYAAFANGGTVWAPHVGAQAVNRAGKVVWSYTPKALSHVPMSAVTRQTILAGLEGVVSNPRGTAYETFLGFPDGQFPVAAKTGTATTPTIEPTALFVAFAPAPDPKYLVMVVIDQAGYGASGAAPVAEKVLTWLMAHPVPAVTPPPAP